MTLYKVLVDGKSCNGEPYHGRCLMENQAIDQTEGTL